MGKACEVCVHERAKNRVRPLHATRRKLSVHHGNNRFESITHSNNMSCRRVLGRLSVKEGGSKIDSSSQVNIMSVASTTFKYLDEPDVKDSQYLISYQDE